MNSSNMPLAEPLGVDVLPVQEQAAGLEQLERLRVERRACARRGGGGCRAPTRPRHSARRPAGRRASRASTGRRARSSQRPRRAGQARSCRGRASARRSRPARRSSSGMRIHHQLREAAVPGAEVEKPRAPARSPRVDQAPHEVLLHRRSAGSASRRSSTNAAADLRPLPGRTRVLARSPPPSHSRMSTKWPSTAAAAAIWGLTRCVRPAAALAALEVAVRGRGAALARLQDVGVHSQAHRAAGLAPLEPGLPEDLVEALLLGLRLHLLRAGHDHRAHGLRRPAGRGPPRRPRAGPRCASWCRSR